MHLAVDGDGLVGAGGLLGGDEQHVVLLEWDVGDLSVENALQVDTDHLECAVGFHAVHHGTCGEGVLGDALGMLHQCAHAVDAVAQLILAGAEHGTLHLYGVLEAGQDGVDAHRVAVGHAERAHVKLLDVVHGILAAGLAHHAHRLLISVAREAARIAQQRLHAFVAFHLVVHRALHLAGDVDQTVVRADDDHVAVVQPYVAGHLAVEDIVVDVAHAHQSAVAVNLDVAQRTDVVGATGHIEGVEHSGEGRQGIGARGVDLTHDVDRHGTGLAQREVDAARAVAAAECGAQACLGSCHGQTAHVHGAVALDDDVAVGSHRAVDAAL